MSVRYMIATLLSALILQAGATKNRDEELTELKAEILDFLLKSKNENFAGTRTCTTTNPFDLNVDGDDTPSALEVNECSEPNRFATQANCDEEFDVSLCETNDCVLGYETDNKGCVKSCACKSEGLLESDIMMTKEDVALFEEAQKDDGMNRAGTRYKRRWNNIPEGKNFIVPYTIDASVAKNPRASAALSAAIKQYSEDTCIRFRPRNSEKDYIEFFRGSGCWSYIGRTGRGKQQLSIGRGCEFKGIVMHEMMHAMGFWHEHSRPDRDSTVVVNYDNINSKYRYNFKKMSPKLVNSFGSAYDIGSVMQYGGYSFSKNKKPTITDKLTGEPVRHQRKGFSPEDVKQLNAMMKCKNLDFYKSEKVE